MSRFVQSEERTQETFLPCRLEDYVTEDNPVRVIDVFVEELDLSELGFAGMQPEATGRPAYHPSTMLKIYIYGYLNRKMCIRDSIKSVMGFRQFMLRGIDRVRGEWRLVTMAWNIKRMFALNPG